MAKENLDPRQIEALVNELETKISRLRAIYEQYFMGIERLPPSTARKDVVRLIHQVENLYVRNTATKFRIRSLVQRFNSYKTYWNRVERQIEEGTYARDIRRAERNRDKRRERSAPREVDGMADDGIIEVNFDDVVDLKDFEVELEALDASGHFDRSRSKPNEPRVPQPHTQAAPADAEARKRAKLAEIAGALGISGGAAAAPKKDVSAIRGATPNRAAPVSTVRETPASTSRAAPASVGAKREKLADIKARLAQRSASASQAKPAARDDDARRVYNQLVEAKRRCNESTEKISYNSVAKSMEKQREQLKKSRGKDVDFKVVIKDGKAFIKPETK